MPHGRNDGTAAHLHGPLSVFRPVLGHLCTKWPIDTGFGVYARARVEGQGRRGIRRHAWRKGRGRRCEGCEGARLHGRRARASRRCTQCAAHSRVHPPVSTVVRKHDAGAMHGECDGHTTDILRTPWRHKGEHRGEPRSTGKGLSGMPEKVKNAKFV